MVVDHFHLLQGKNHVTVAATDAAVGVGVEVGGNGRHPVSPGSAGVHDALAAVQALTAAAARDGEYPAYPYSTTASAHHRGPEEVCVCGRGAGEGGVEGGLAGAGAECGRVAVPPVLLEPSLQRVALEALLAAAGPEDAQGDDEERYDGEHDVDLEVEGGEERAAAFVVVGARVCVVDREGQRCEWWTLITVLSVQLCIRVSIYLYIYVSTQFWVLLGLGLFSLLPTHP